MSRQFVYRLAALIVAALLLPLFLSPSYATLWVLVGLTTLVVLGLTLLLGYTGQPSLGQGAFYGIGAYAVAIGTTTYHLPFLVAAFLGCIISLAAAGLIGLVIFRLRDHFLALATLSIGYVIYAIMAQSSLTHGAVGISGIPALAIFGMQITDPGDYSYIVWGVVVIALILSDAAARGPGGYVMRAIGQDEAAAQSLGINPLRHKVSVFMFAALLGAIAGSLYAPFMSYVSADAFTIWVSIQVLVMAVLGGLGDIFGAVLGALVLSVLNQGMSDLSSSLVAIPAPVMENVVYGFLLIAVVVWRPRGFLSSWTSRSRPREAHVVAEENEA